ncbi:hypothetical protein HLI_11715 [Halobacillus litoralis]|uniref:DUF2213 domain-containing protein n=1 Tax=Halobacillus litoralis TaxID=45668 RepID=A0A410MDR2_9BACI|nr:hypothetical protein HLI_11715 [Halobacillus litoralis]
MKGGDTLSKKQRFDRAFIKDYNETDEGYLTVRAIVTKPGVYPYGREDGSIQHELKHPEDIFSDRTVQSCNAKPVTDDHPNEPVNMKNIKAYGKGMSHTDASVQGGGVMVGFTITDEELINKIFDGKREISLGFMTDLVAEDGTYNSKNYQFRQTNVEVNHIAIVDQGRVGPEAAIKGDSSGWRKDSAAWQVDDNNSNNGGGNMPTIKIDNKDYEVDSAVKSRIDALESKEQQLDSVTKERDTLQGTVDANKTKMDGLEKELENAKKSGPSQEDMQKAVDARLSLIDSARNYLEEDFDYTTKSDKDIKVAVIQKADGNFKADDKSDEYVNARFDGTVSVLQSNGFQSTGPNQMKGTNDSAGNLDKQRQDRLNLRDSK